MKKQGKRITALTVSAMLMLNMAATAVPVSAEGESKVYTHDGYTVEYTVKNEWTGNQNIEVTITNTGDDVLSGWAMGYNAFGEIGGLWNAKVYGHQGTEYILSSAGYNDELAPGQSTNFGYTLTGDKFKIPQNIVNCAERVDITEGYNVYYNITADFVDTYQAEMIIENTSDTDISAWQLSFNGNVTINDLWNGRMIENSNGSFKVKNSENNSVIAAGSSVSFNFGGTKNTETEPNLGYSEPVETLPPVPVVTDEFTEAETAAESAETDAANPETDPAETEIPSETVMPEITTVTESVVMPVSEVVFSNYKLTGMVIPMEFDFEIDPEVDSDNDGLPDYLEKELGTDRYNADTDGDGLPDGYEYFTLGTDPKKADSDDNGISDADEDFDEDGLTNLEEYELGTDPFSKDTDNDGLSDYDEVKIHNTDPLKYDTDGDKVSDGDEVILGLDPNNPATFGYPDNEYTTVQTVGEGSSALDYINNIEDNPYSVTIEITAAGVADNNLAAGESGYSYSILQNDAVLGVVPEFDYSDGLSITDVVIKFKIDDSAVEGGLGIFDEGGINRYGIFMYFEDTNTLLPIETFYDESTNSISTHVDRLGTVCIVDVEKWLNYLDTLPDEPYYLENDEKNEPGNVVFCIDTRLAADEANFENVKSDIKIITEDVFERYDDIKVYVYYQEFGMNFRAKNNLLYDNDGKDYFTSYETAAEAIDNMTITKKSFSYDLVEATNFMIDICDENLLAIYHITDTGKVVGSIDDAKQLVQTVKNSKYTQKKDEKEINRIYVSLICLNGQIDNKSYINDLVDTSMGMIYTGENSIESEVEPADYSIMTLDLASANTDEQSGTVKSTNGQNTNIYGDGKDLTFFKLLTSSGFKDINLDTPLRYSGYYAKKGLKPTDSDDDGLEDWIEVDFDILCALKGYSTENITSLKYDDLPSLLDYQKYYLHEADKNSDSYQYVLNGIYALQAQYKEHYSDNYQYCILPIKSDPTMADSDNDGYLDSILNDEILNNILNPQGYIDVADPEPLYSNVKKYQLRSNYISVDGFNVNIPCSYTYGGYQGAFYDEKKNKDNYDKIGKFIANNGCGLIAFSDTMLYLSNYNMYRSLTDIYIESYSEGYIPFNEYQDYVRSIYMFYDEEYYINGITILFRYVDFFNKYFNDKNVNLNAKSISLRNNAPYDLNIMLNNKVLKQITTSLEKGIPVYLGMDKLANPIVYDFHIILYGNYDEKPYKIVDGLKTNDSFRAHAVVITGVIIDSIQNKKIIEVSSWGEKYVIDMDNLLEEARHSTIGTGVIIIS